MSLSTTPRVGWLLVVLGVLAGVYAGLPGQLLSSWAYALERGRLAATGDELARADEVSSAFRRVAKLARPGVVQIQVAGTEEQVRDLRRRYERILRQYGQEFDEQRWQEFQRQHMVGTGSGVVLDADGHILTNNHVVADQAAITVRLHDGRELPAERVGTDPKTDLAVIRIAADRLHPLRFGDSEAMEVGDWVLAIGAPFGLSHSVTHGIVSAKGRSDVFTRREGIDARYQNYLQTDAAINPGNSGGPLLNLRGEVIGINMAIASEDGVNAGVAFTIPSNLARRVAEQLMRSGAVARGWLGVMLGELNGPLARALEAPDEKGVLVDRIYEQSPAHAAGLQCEDVILAVNGTEVREIRGVQQIVADVPPGETVRLRVLRDGKPIELDVVVGRQPDDLDRFARSVAMIESRMVEPLNVEARSAPSGVRAGTPIDNPEESAAARAARARPGMIVLDAAEASAEAPLRPGDLVVAANGRAVASVAALTRAIAGAPQAELTVVGPRGDERSVVVRLDR